MGRLLFRLRFARRLLSSGPVISEVNKEIVLALKKREGQGLEQDESERRADVNVDVLSLLSKSNVRFTLSHQRGKKGEEAAAAEEEEEDDENKHYAPQHRRFLTFPKVKDSGSPSQREKVDNRMRLDRAVSNAHKYQLESLGLVDQSAGHNALAAHKGLSSIIEDKIQLSILQGDFDNLKGEGKQQERWTNPFVDVTEDLALDILKKNGVRPDWVESQQNMTALNNHLRSVIRMLALRHMVESPPGTTLDRAALVKSVEDRERVCWHYTDIYNLQVPSWTLTRGRISATYDLEQILSSLDSTPSDDLAPSSRADLLSLLDEARQSVEASLHLANRLKSERRGSHVGAADGDDGSGRNLMLSHTSVNNFYGSPWRESAKPLKDQGLSAGGLAMNFFLQPVDGLVRLLKRVL